MTDDCLLFPNHGKKVRFYDFKDGSNLDSILHKSVKNTIYQTFNLGTNKISE